MIDTLGIVLKAFGYLLSIQPIKLEHCNSDSYTDTFQGQNTSAHLAKN